MIILKNWLINFRSEFLSQKNKKIDYLLLFIVIAMVLFGLIMVYSSSFIYAQEKTGDGFSLIRKQLIYSGIGFLFLWIASYIPYQKWSDWAYPVLILAAILLALILVPGIGLKVGGARRWIRLAQFQFQPGEFAKFAVLFFVSRQLVRKQERMNTFTAGILSHYLVPLPILLLLLLQPDFGTTMMISIVICILIFLAGVPLRLISATLIVGGGIASWLAIGTAYRRSRLITFLDPWQDPSGKGFQIIQSFIGLHHGRFLGVGLGNGKEKLFYLPEAHNDFIFSVIGEELGFCGVLIVALVYLFFVYRGLKIAWDCYLKNQDQFGMLLAASITLALGLQGFVNMAVVLGLVPTKGLTLPFISYGGSALLVDLFAVGVLLNVSRNLAVKTSHSER